MTPTVRVEPLGVEDLAQVVRIHCRAFGARGGLASLGPEAVRRYYAWQLEGPHDVVAITASDRETMLGYCVGGLFHGSMSGFLRNERWFLLGAVLRRPWVAARPSVWRRVPRALRALRATSRRPTVAPSTTIARFGVLAMAVDPAQRRRGVGALLMRGAEERARAGGFAHMHLTVNPSNREAVAFYESLGWRRVDAESHPNAVFMERQVQACA